MSERLVPLVLDEYYHIYNRGNSKQEIFKNNSDYARFMQLLYLSNGTKSFKVRDLGAQDPYEVDMGDKLIAIGAYCLMPNHFHILARPLVEGGMTTFMKKLGTGYSGYFNKKYGRTGGLFEGKFKSQHADSDEYLKYLFSYIHLNPVKLIQSDWKEQGIKDKAGASAYLKKYPWSSYLDLIPTGRSCVERRELGILGSLHFPDYFKAQQTIDEELSEWLKYVHNVD